MISIVVPILNEQDILSNALNNLRATVDRFAKNLWEVVLVDAGSTDGSDLVAEAFAQTYGWTFVAAHLSSPSVGRTVNEALSACRGTTALVLPCDCRVDTLDLAALLERLDKNANACGGFLKRYEPSTFALRAYAALQNRARSTWLRHLVWTNVLFFPLPQTIPQGGFLEDVFLSDELRSRDGWKVIPRRVSVSARRYFPNRVFRRIFLNGAIMLFHRTRLASTARLHTLYRALK